MTNNSSVEEGRGGFPAHVAGHGRRPTWVRIGHSGPFSVRPLIPREPKSRTRLGRSETCQYVWPGRAPNWHPVSWLRRADRSSISSFHLADLGGEAVDPKL